MNKTSEEAHQFEIPDDIVAKYDKNNTLNGILIKYHEFTPEGEPVQKTISLTEFINLDPKRLEFPGKDSFSQLQVTKMQKDLRKAIIQLYLLNNRIPPLFSEFPDRGKDFPLTIDIASYNQYFLRRPSDLDIMGANAAYSQSENLIQIKPQREATDFLLTLAHELKHAECGSQEMLDFEDKAKHNNHKAWQQNRFIDEARAYCFEDYIKELLDNPEAKNDNFGKKMTDKLNVLFTDNNFLPGYLYKYDRYCPVSMTDKGLDQIPDFFHIPSEHHQTILDKLQEMPKLFGIPWRLLDSDQPLKEYQEEFSSLSDTEVGMVFSLLYADRHGYHGLTKFLMLYDKSNNQKDLQDQFYELCSSKKLGLMRSQMTYFWLKRTGKSAVKKEWIEKARQSTGIPLDLEFNLQNFLKNHPNDERFPEATFRQNLFGGKELTNDDREVFSSLSRSPEWVQVLFCHATEDKNPKALEELLNLYDKTENTADLSYSFYQLFPELSYSFCRLFPNRVAKIKEEQSSYEPNIRTWLQHEGNSAIKKEWIDTIFNKNQYYLDSLGNASEKFLRTHHEDERVPKVVLLKHLLHHEKFTDKDYETFAELSDQDVKTLFERVQNTEDDKVFKSFLDLYDKTNSHQINLENYFYPLVKNLSDSEKSSAAEDILFTWLEHKGNGAIQKEWIKNIKNINSRNYIYLKKKLYKYGRTHPKDTTAPIPSRLSWAWDTVKEFIARKNGRH